MKNMLYTCSAICLKEAASLEKEADHLLLEGVIYGSADWVCSDEQPPEEAEEAYAACLEMYDEVENLREMAKTLAIEEAEAYEWERLETRLLQGRR